MTDEIQNHPLPIKPDNFDDVVFSLEICKLKTAKIEGNNIVVGVQYSLRGEYEGITHSHDGEIWFDPATVVIDGNFIPFENLTKEVVSQWVAEKYPETHIKYSLAEILLKAHKVNTERNNPNLPWSN